MSNTVGANNALFYIDRSGNLIDQKFKQKDMDRHKKRLEEISKRNSRQQSKLVVEYSAQLNNNKKLIHENQQNKRQDGIDKDNEILLKKLVQIQAGKRSLIPKTQSLNEISDQRSQSLHIVQRRLELDRIERENIKIAQKIFELKPYLQVSDLEQKFHQQKRYGLSIRKIIKKKIAPRQLPPLGDESLLRSVVSKSVIVNGSGGGSQALLAAIQEGSENPPLLIQDSQIDEKNPITVETQDDI